MAAHSFKARCDVNNRNALPRLASKTGRISPTSRLMNDGSRGSGKPPGNHSMALRG